MKELRYHQAINEALAEEMARDEKVFIIGEDVVAGGAFAAMRGLVERFGPGRVRNTPISESAFLGLALGAAIYGLRPVAEIMMLDFLTVCMDPLVNHAAKMRYMFGGQYKVPLTVLTAGGGGQATGPHHSQNLEAWLAHVPGLKVVMPSTPKDVKGLIKAAIRDDNPVVVIYHKGMLRSTGQVPEEDYVLPIGKAEVKRLGKDVTIVATSAMVLEALKAAEKLSQEGIEAEVVDPRTISPLDKDTILQSVQKTGRLVVAHEAVKNFGVGAEIAAIVAEEGMDYLDAPIKRIGSPFTPTPFSPDLEKVLLPTFNHIVAAAKEVCGVAVEH